VWHCGNPAQFRIDLRINAPSCNCFRELARVENYRRARLNFAGIDLRIINGFFTGLYNDVPDRFPSFFRLRLKSVRPPPRM